jgi:hypothetical protein
MIWPRLMEMKESLRIVIWQRSLVDSRAIDVLRPATPSSILCLLFPHRLSQLLDQLLKTLRKQCTPIFLPILVCERPQLRNY